MRASTAAGINISLLPQDATAGDLPVVPSGEEASFFWCLLVAMVLSREGASCLWYSCGFADGHLLVVLYEEASFSGVC